MLFDDACKAYCEIAALLDQLLDQPAKSIHPLVPGLVGRSS